MDGEVPRVALQEAEDDQETDRELREDVYLALKTHADLNLEKEYTWLEQRKCMEVFDRLLGALKEVGRRLHLGQKMDARLKLPITQPKTDILQLSSRSGGDAVKANITLLGDNVIACEIALKHSKSPGGTYRGVAQPEVQWKLQQLQDLANYIVRTVFILLEARARMLALIEAKVWDKKAGAILHSAIREARTALSSARNACVLPKKRTLLELCQFPPTKKFNPPFPSDQIVSIYVSGARLICAVYQVNTKQVIGSGKDVGVFSAECTVPGMPQVLHLINGSLRYLQGFLTNLDAMEPKF